MMLIEGRRYRTRSGRIVGPMIRKPEFGIFLWRYGTDGWQEHGYFCGVATKHDMDLVDLAAVDKPFFEVTLEEYRRGVAKVMGW